MEIKIFPSTINRVSLRRVSGETFIRKEYPAKGIRSAVELPVDRALIEFQVMHRLSRIAEEFADSIRIPHIIDYHSSPRWLDLEYLTGNSLRDLPVGRWPDASKFRRLFEFLVLVGQSEPWYKTADPLAIVGRTMRDALIAYKVKDTVPRGLFATNTNCLGDLTLGNILWDGNHLILIDFEFAHIGTAGFDLGLFFGEFSSLFSFGHLNESMGLVIAEGLGAFPQAVLWMEIFRKYYDDKHRERGL